MTDFVSILYELQKQVCLEFAWNPSGLSAYCNDQNFSKLRPSSGKFANCFSA